MKINKSEYIKSAVLEKDYPEEKGVEFSFLGRSNVGKSSLINSLLNRKNLARTSKTPGRTQLINYFLINDTFYFVDLPGYGFAKVPDSIKKDWNKTFTNYLVSKRQKVVFLLLDIRRIPNNDDLAMLEWLTYYNIEYYIIFTKIDKLSKNQITQQLKKIKEVLEFDKDDVFYSSSLTKQGMNDIIGYINKLLEEHKNKNKEK